MRSIFCRVLAATILTGFLAVSRAGAHGYVGARLFPATLTTDDPLAADELALPELSMYTFPAGGDGPETRDLGAGFEFDKVIIPKLALGIEDLYSWQRPRGGKTAQGWDDLTLLVKYEVWRDEPHEAIISVGLETDLGGTGTRAAGRDPFTTFTPTFYFGKGFGDLPASIGYLRPFAATGTIGQTIPTEAEQPTLEWGMALEYSLPYLQQQVQDVGLPEPFRNMIPVVEFAMDTPESRGPLGTTTGTVNPGVLWESKYVQVGVEALVPINRASGEHLGVAVTLEIYIDDLFPKIFGHPMFGE